MWSKFQMEPTRSCSSYVHRLLVLGPAGTVPRELNADVEGSAAYFHLGCGVHACPEARVG